MITVEKVLKQFQSLKVKKRTEMGHLIGTFHTKRSVHF